MIREEPSWRILEGLPWWYSALGFTCQFDSWSRKIPHTQGHLGVRHNYWSPHALEPSNQRRHRNEKPCTTTRAAPTRVTREGPHAAIKTQCNQKLMNYKKKTGIFEDKRSLIKGHTRWSPWGSQAAWVQTALLRLIDNEAQSRFHLPPIPVGPGGR